MTQKQQESINYQEPKEVDFESFQETQNKVNQFKAGFGRIIGCKVLDKEEIEQSDDKELAFDKYLQLNVDKNGSVFSVHIPLFGDKKSGDLEFCYNWTGVNSIDSLAGKRIPIKFNSQSQSYELEKFNNNSFKYIPLNGIKKLIDSGIITTDLDNQWNKPMWLSKVISLVYVLMLSLIASVLVQYTGENFIILMSLYFAVFHLPKSLPTR